MAGVSALNVRIQSMTHAAQDMSAAMRRVGQSVDFYAASHAFIEDGGDVQWIRDMETHLLGRPISAAEVIDLVDSLS